LQSLPPIFFFLATAKHELPRLPSSSFRSTPPKYSYMGSAVSSTSGGLWGIAPADKRLGAYWSQKVQLWWQQFLLIFLQTNVIFCTKQD